MKTPLIIGCGYIGMPLAQLWTSQDIDVTATTTRPERLDQLKAIATHAALLKGNDLDTLQRLLEGKDAVVVTVAARGADTYQTTYLDTANSLVKALAKTPKVCSIVYTSSTSVYGEQDGQWVDESTPLNPSNPQAEILVETEKMLLAAATNTCKVCILRLGEIVGPERSPKERLKHSLHRVLPGTGQNYTNQIHRDDIVRAIDAAINYQLSGVYNLCNDLHITRKELYDQICSEEGWPPVSWDATQRTVHGGNKRVSSSKFLAAVPEFKFSN